MALVTEEYFDISRNERASFFTGPKGGSKIKELENQSGARIRVVTNSPTDISMKVYGNSSQRLEAKVLIRDALEKTSFIPMISYFVLTESNKNKLKFVRFDDNDDYSGRTHYTVEFLQRNNERNDIDDITYRFDNHLRITPLQFNTYDKLDDCLERLSLKLKTILKKSSTNSLFSEELILKPRIFFGKVLFSDVNDPEDNFTVQDWYKFNVLSGRGRRESINDDSEYYNDSKTVNTEFKQDSPKIYDDFKTFQQKFGFKLDHKQIVQGKDKGSINVYYSPSTNKKRKLKLRWDKTTCKWKISHHFYGLNRLANIDIVSGSKTPDFRLSIKNHYNLSSEGSKVEEVINNIQYDPHFDERSDEMWFKSSDFENTIIKRAVVRQTVEKKRFRNENFIITFSTIKHCDNNDKITTQKLITLKHKAWAQEISLGNVKEFMDNIVDTFDHVQRMMSILV